MSSGHSTQPPRPGQYADNKKPPLRAAWRNYAKTAYFRRRNRRRAAAPRPPSTIVPGSGTGAKTRPFQAVDAVVTIGEEVTPSPVWNEKLKALPPGMSREPPQPTR